MLFRTVYGPELAAIFNYIQKQNEQQVYPTKEMLFDCFIPRLSPDQFQTSQNVEDALSFLSSAQVIEYELGWRVTPIASSTPIPFRLLVLMQIQRISTGQIPEQHPLDPIYGQILSELFVSPDKTYIDNLHLEVNRLSIVRTNGGLSKEKLQAWKRVMQFFGIGVRVQNGFLCSYTPLIINQIVSMWEKEQGTLQEFIENHFSRFLPCTNRNGEIAKCAANTLLWLHEQGQINLLPLQDSPTRFYFYEKKIRGLQHIRSAVCTS